MEKALTGGIQQKSRVMGEEERRTIAYHEAGHAVVMHSPSTIAIRSIR